MSECDACAGAEETFSRLCEQCCNEEAQDHKDAVARARQAGFDEAREMAAKIARRIESGADEIHGNGGSLISGCADEIAREIEHMQPRDGGE